MALSLIPKPSSRVDTLTFHEPVPQLAMTVKFPVICVTIDGEEHEWIFVIQGLVPLLTFLGSFLVPCQLFVTDTQFFFTCSQLLKGTV
jgi:hypothetical protein